MATITATNMKSPGAKDATATTLTGTADTFTYRESRDPVLILSNPTAGSITPTITGDAATTFLCPGIGEVDVSTGYDVGAILAGESVAIALRSVSAYLAGVIDITSGTGLEAQLLEF